MRNIKFLIVKVFLLCLVIVFSISLSLFAAGEEYPNRTITAIIAAGVGGSTDVSARILSEKLKVELGQPIIIVNKKGGGGVIGLKYFLAEPTDGYTVCIMTNEGFQSAISTGIEPIDQDDFKYVGGYMMQAQIVIAHKNAPYKTFDELIAYAKENPGKLSIGSGGSVWALDIWKTIAINEGLKMNYVLFDSGADASANFLGGHVDIAQTGVGTAAYQAARAGDAIVLAKLGEGSVPGFANVPSTKELGYTEFEMNIPYGIFLHKEVPENIREKWEQALKKVIEDPEIIAKMEKNGWVPQFINSKKFEELNRGTVTSSIELLEYVKKLKE